MRLRQLRHPWRHDGIDEANPNARNDSCTDKHIGVLARGHQGRTENGEAGTDPDSLLPAQFVAR